MSSSTIYKSVNASNRNLIILSILALAIAIGVGVYSSLPYFMAKFSEPTILDEAALAALTDESAPLYFQQIKAEYVFDAGYEEYTRYDDGRERTDAYFAAAWVGDALVMVRLKNPVDDTQTVYTGAFVRPSDIQREIFDDIQSEAPDLVEDLVPLVLDTIDKEFQWYGGAAILGVLALGGIGGIMTFVQRSTNPSSHPIMKKLAPYGDVDTVIDSIEKELGSMPDEVGKLKLTRNWLIHKNGANFEAIPYRDLLWAYKFIQKGKYNTKTYFAYICDKHGKLVTVQAKEEQVNIMLEAIMSRAPWIIGGYSDDVKKAWDTDRQQLVAAVEQRKAQFDAQNSSM